MGKDGESGKRKDEEEKESLEGREWEVKMDRGRQREERRARQKEKRRAEKEKVKRDGLNHTEFCRGGETYARIIKILERNYKFFFSQRVD